MNTPNSNPSPNEIELMLHAAAQLADLLPCSEGEVAELEAMFGETPVELSERLRDPQTVAAKIAQMHPAGHQPPFARLLTMLRTERDLSINQLAHKLGLDADELRRIEDGTSSASPMAVVVVSEFFSLEPQKAKQLAGLTRLVETEPRDEMLLVAACAKPTFDSLDAQERAAFHALVKQLRAKD